MAEDQSAIAVLVERFGGAEREDTDGVRGDIEGAGSEEARLVNTEVGVGGNGEGWVGDADAELDAVGLGGDGGDSADLATPIADGGSFANSGDVGEGRDKVERRLAEGAAF